MVKYIPIATSILSIIFFIQIYRHYRSKPNAKYLLWWTLGVLTFGIGTLTESIQAVFGWSEPNTKIWYIVGALLGGFPLAQGTVYLFLKRKTANILTIIFVSLIVIDSILILITPVIIPPNFDYRLTGKIFAWHFVRYVSPFINLYSLIFLAGGALYSAYKYYKLGKSHARFLGNIFISIGALLPGIGGSFTRFGHVEVLFITEFLGLSCIYYGYVIMKNDKTPSFQSLQAN
jgi:DMSO reductase anchor subunit